VAPITASVTEWLKRTWAAVDWAAIAWGGIAVDAEIAKWIDGIDWKGIGKNWAKGLFTTAQSGTESAGLEIQQYLPQELAGRIAVGIFEAVTHSQVLRSMREGVVSLSRGFVEGFLEGISDLGARLGAYLNNQMNAALARMRNELEMHSPSGVTRRIGEDMVSGLLLGVSSLERDLSAALVNAAEGATSDAQDAIARDMATALAGGYARATEGNINRDMDLALAGGYGRATEGRDVEAAAAQGAATGATKALDKLQALSLHFHWPDGAELVTQVLALPDEVKRLEEGLAAVRGGTLETARAMGVT
jgi:hypothetical protein